MPEPGLWNYPTLGNASLTTEALSELSAQPPRPMPLPQFDYGPDSEKAARPPKRRGLPGP